MTGTREQEIQHQNPAAPYKVRTVAKPDVNPCGGCNACHQMTGIQASSGIMELPGGDAAGSAMQKSCATSFFQRNLGNSYMQSVNTPHGGGSPTIQRKCNCGGSCESCAGKEDEAGKIQTKLAIGAPDDVYEQEADRVAEQVMKMSEPSLLSGDNAAGNSMNIQRISESSGSAGIPGEGIDIDQNGGETISFATRRFMEPRFDADFGGVRLHTDENAHKTAAQIQARAFTYGNHIWLGSGESEHDRGLMAHELTHVVQQGASPRVQAARLPCTSRKTVDVYAINLPGSTRTIGDDLTNANNVLCQCGIELKLAGGESWNTNLLDLDPPAGVLNENTSAPTREISTMLSYRPGGNAIHAYYVPANSLGDRGGSYGFGGMFPQFGPSVSITNIAAMDTFPHEFGHVLTNDAGHHPDPNNLMASGSIRNVGIDELEQSQCSRMP